MNRFDRRRFLSGSGALLGAGALGLSGCGSSGSGDANELTLGWWGNPERDERTREAIKTFQKQQKGVTIKEQITEWDAYWDKLSTQLAGGNAPDLIQMDYAYITQYAKQGTLLELDEHIPKQLDIANFDKSQVNSGTVDGKLYGASLGMNTPTMYYNATMLDELGIELPDEITWSGFADLAREVAGKAPEGSFGAGVVARADVPYEVWLIQRGGVGLYDENGKLAYTADDLTEWLELWYSLYQDKILIPAEREDELSGSVEDSGSVTRLSPFDFAWSNQYAAFAGAAKDEMGIHAFPVGDASDSQPGQFYKASMMLSINAKTESLDLALEFGNALLTDPEVAGKLGFERGLPADPAVMDALLQGASKEDKASAEFLESFEGNTAPVPPPEPEQAVEIDEVWAKSMDGLFYGEMSLNEAVDNFFSEAEKILE